MSGIKEVLTKAKRSKIVKEIKPVKDNKKKNGFQSIVDKATREYSKESR